MVVVQNWLAYESGQAGGVAVCIFRQSKTTAH